MSCSAFFCVINRFLCLFQLLAEQLRGLSSGSVAGTIGAAAKFSISIRVCHTCLSIICILVQYGDAAVVAADNVRSFWIKVGLRLPCTLMCDTGHPERSGAPTGLGLGLGLIIPPILVSVTTACAQTTGDWSCRKRGAQAT